MTEFDFNEYKEYLLQKDIKINDDINTLDKDLNSSLYHFISEKNIFPDENTVNFPKFILNYILEHGKNENDVIQSLIGIFFKNINEGFNNI